MEKRIRPWRGVITFLICFGMLLSIFCGMTFAEKKPKIVFGYSPYADYAPFFVAKEKGYFEAFGIDVKLIPKSGTAETYQLIAAGQLTAGGSSWGASFFNAVDRGALVSIVAPVASMPMSGKSPSPFMVSIKAWESGEVRGVSDLKGKRIGMPGPAGFGEYSVMLALKQGGIKITDVELVNVPPPMIGPAMVNGGIVASWTIEPFATTLKKNGFARVLVDDHARGVEIGFLCFETKFANNYPEMVNKFLAAYIKAVRELEKVGWTDPDINKIVMEYTQLSGDILQEIGMTVRNLDGKIDIQSVREQEAYYRKRGQLEYKGELDLDKVYRRDLMEKAIKILERQ